VSSTEKLIAVLLPANLALAGALYLLLPGGSSPAHPERPSAPTSTEISNAGPRNPIAPITEAGPPDPADDWHDWVVRDPHAAVEWAARQPADEKRDAVLVAACYEIANTHPAEAVALAEKYALIKNATLANLAEQWAREDLKAVYAWVLAKPAGAERDELAARVGYVWSATQPAEAASFVLQEIPPGPVQTEAAISILHQWALRDAGGASAWANRFPEGALRERALDEAEGTQRYLQAMAADPRGR